MKKRAYMWSGVLLAALLLVSTVLTGCTTSSESIAPALNAVSPVAASAAPSGAPQEGIKVHGHWTIEVRNPDGTMVERREFDNALFLPTGSMGLARVLGRADSVKGWWIVLFADQTVNSPFLHPGGVIVEATNEVPDPDYFKNLTLDLPTSGANANKLVLSGTATADRNGNIQDVRTAFDTEALPSAAPPYMYPGNTRNFTRTVLGNPVNLIAGQQVIVTVVISFS
jgi:hypothetical protein